MKVIQWNSAKCLGGAEYRVLELSQQLSLDGYEVCIVCRKHSLLENKVKKAGLKNISYHNNFTDFFRLLWFTIKWQPDIIHVHTGKDYFPALLIGLLTSVPVVCHRRLMSKINSITQLLFELTNSKIIAISNIVKDVLVKENKIDKNKIKVVYNAIPDSRVSVNYERLKELKKIFCTDGKKIIVSVGNLYPTKGFDELIKVSKILKEKIDHLVIIVGEGKERKKLEHLIKQYGLEETVKLLGRREDVMELITLSDCFVLLSYEEPFGTVFIEALSCGKPVVGYNVGGVPEIIKNNEVGFLVEPHNIQAVADKVYTILTDDELYKKMSAKAKQYFYENFSFSKMVQEIKDVYFEMISQRRNIHGN